MIVINEHGFPKEKERELSVIGKIDILLTDQCRCLNAENVSTKRADFTVRNNRLIS